MAKIETVTIAGKQYNIAQAPAKEQKTLLTLVGALVAANSAGSKHEINVKFLKGSLLAVGEDKLDKISNIVLPRVFLSGSETCVSVDSFQGLMNAYLEVLATAVKVNLADFFMWLDEENQDAISQSQKTRAE